MDSEEIKTTIHGLQFLKEKLYNGIFSDRLDCIDYAINALKEVQYYREIGTVEECREAVEKQKPKKPNRSGMDEQDYYVCPNCGADIGSIDDYFPRDRYRHECGQAIQWGENLEGMKDVTSEM